MRIGPFRGVVLAAVLAGAAAAEPATIAVEGTGRASAVPDLATLSAGVETRGETAAEALAANADAMGRVLAALAKAGVAGPAVQTGGLSVSPVQTRPRNASDGAPEIDHYRVYNGVSLQTQDLDRLGALLDALVGAGANRVGQLGFALSDPAAQLAEARAAAVADARAAAEAYAGAAGLELGPLLEIRAVQGGGVRPEMRAVAMDAGGGTLVERGETTVSASVTVVWQLTGP